MFTGLIEEVGQVKSIRLGTVNRLSVISRLVSEGISLGDSVAVNGVCLTVTQHQPEMLTFDFVRETASRTTLGLLAPGDYVNLESSLNVGEALGGHFVLGHVDGLCTLEKVRALADSRELSFLADSQILKLVVEKGSVALDGISLTVASCDSNGFTVALIPHSLQYTNLQHKKPGDKMNVETDILGKYVHKLVSNAGQDGSITMELLQRNGFV